MLQGEKYKIYQIINSQDCSFTMFFGAILDFYELLNLLDS